MTMTYSTRYAQGCQRYFCDNLIRHVPETVVMPATTGIPTEPPPSAARSGAEQGQRHLTCATDPRHSLCGADDDAALSRGHAMTFFSAQESAIQ